MITYIVKKRKITLLFFVMVVLVGFLSFFQLPKQESPDIIVNLATVTTIYPGASPEKVEQTVTKKLEEKINELQGLSYISSTSSLGVSSIIVEAKSDVDPKQKWDELRKKVKDAEAELPADAKQPIINDDLNRTFVQTFAVTADSREQLYSMRDMLKSWKEQLRTIPNVADVQVEGLPKQEVHIEVDTQKLSQYGITWSQVMMAVKRENEKIPLGDLTTDKRTYQLKLAENVNVEELNNVLISRTQAGFPIYLKDIGQAKLTTETVKSVSYYNGKPSISVSINAETGSDVPSLQKRVDEMMLTLDKSLPVWAERHSIYSQNERVDELFSDLTREMIIAVIAVLLVCTLGLNLITSFVVALAIPISLAVGLLFLPSLGITMNMISIVSLIIVLGILVDDAVVVNDNIERRLSVLGEKPLAAAVNGAREVSISIVTATLATIASFAPLMFLNGNAGQFIRPVPAIISLTMLASMIMSLTIIPIFRQWYEERRKAGAEGYRKPAGLLGKQLTQLTNWYAGKLMPKILKRPLLAGMIGVLIGTAAYGLIPLTPVQLFPNDDRPQFLVDIRVPVGSSLEETDRVVRGVSDWIMKQHGIESVASYAGGSAPKMFGGDTEAGSGITVGQLVVRFNEKETKIENMLEPWTEEFKKMYPEATVLPKQLEAGPPVGKPVVIRVYGEDIETLRSLAAQIKDKVAGIAGTYDVQDNFGVERYTLEFVVNKELMEQKLVNYTDLSTTLRLVSEGISVSEFDTGDELIDMKLFLQKGEEDPALLFQRLSIANARGELIPLSQLAEVKPTFSTQAIPHRDLSRSVTVSADVKNRTATEVMTEIQPMLDSMSLPEGYRIDIGGETSEQTDIFIDMGKLSILVVFLILILIAMQFYSLSIPVLVMSTVYLAVAGSLIGLFVTQTPLGFMTMMGVISLSGIVVRNGIVFIEFIEEARHAGAELKQAVISAGEARLRPILLTSFTAVAGLMPLAISGDVLFKPLAVTIISGLLFSTLLTLIVVPSFYTVLTQRKLKKQAKKAAKRPDLYGPEAEMM
ncbi:efflux RND transporter permease subunit [Brevibacillus agri]|uniref:efflux RND transporter permease subunit n=1 Tax=Brevibacillus agri TaxID=51101 RepID=UPI001C8DAAC3|nr:efflux RND transporter permease subunit [Brevibacillus agri]MBY0052680.1 efflux RND transporter permease subunit [Brevibacillus agri]MCG5250272.1 efflux RND transporter permease subunit [Brevibacillus agri]MDN4091622.1 efflux RND transporter permease subunit [Brevibacillus agri]MDR9504567.1 efflux RND transporter permease subunit [Brevibacillus agri]MED4568102.1 efflux RND transporter permease subunit [Brevibacillus agri]